MPSKNYTLGRRIKQQRCSNELTGWMQAPPPPPASRSPPPYPTQRSSSTTASFLSLSSSAAVKVGREVRCLRELREHSCLFQTGHHPPPWPPPAPRLTKGTFIHPGPGNHCGVYSACTHTHTYTLKMKKNKNMCAPWCGKFVHGKQSVSVCSYGGTHTHTQTYRNILA